MRPTDSAAGRRRVALVLSERPAAPAREVARLPGSRPRVPAGDPALRYSTAGRALLQLLSLTLGPAGMARLTSAVLTVDELETMNRAAR